MYILLFFLFLSLKCYGKQRPPWTFINLLFISSPAYKSHWKKKEINARYNFFIKYYYFIVIFHHHYFYPVKIFGQSQKL